MKFKLFYILFLFISSSLFCQSIDRLAVVSGQKTNYIPVYDRQGTIYFSIRDYAEALSIPYYFNPKTNKIELNFQNYNLKITAKNPFIVTTAKDESDNEIFQLPTSTYFLRGRVFIPLKYTINMIANISGSKLKFVHPDKLIVSKESTVRIPRDEHVATPVSSSYAITGINISPKANGTLVRIKSHKRILAYNSFFKDGILSIIFRNVHADVTKINNDIGKGLIKKVKVRNINSDTEFKFKVDKNYSSSEVLNVDNSDDIQIAIHNKLFTENMRTKREKEKWDFNVIVIDPGHGGKDSGTIGVDGIEEKNVNLAIALKLGKIIKQKMKDVKVVFTRKTDKFVELYRRGQIANEAGGNLFISIHCNATPHKPSAAEGYEVYLLRPGKTKAAIRIAERENSVISYESNPKRYEKLTAENFILVSMAQSAYMKYSEKFSDILNNEFSHDISISSRGVKQAGFYVLVGASMPSVLIETGFLSNRRDARYLNSRRGQSKIAEAIYEAIKKFKAQYDKSYERE